MLPVAAFTGAVLLATAGPALADGIACPTAIAGNVTISTGCQVGGAHSDFRGNSSPYQVNLDALFGFDDWLFAGKALEEGEEGVDLHVGFGVDGNRLAGEWFVSDDAWTSLGITQLMLVLKGGSPHQPKNADGESGFAAYLIQVGETSGDYNSPFIHFRNGTPTDVSHISAYVRQGETEIPEPMIVGLLGLGVAGLLRRRRTVRRKAD